MKAPAAILSIAGLILLVIVITALEIYIIQMPTTDLTTRVLLIVVLTVNFVALITLAFFVGRSLFKLYMERQHQVMGHKFRTKLVIIFGTLILIPSLSLFITASGLATNYINKILAPHGRELLDRSVDLARSFYDYERDRVLKTALDAASGGETSPSDIEVKYVEEIPVDASETMRKAFDGVNGTEIITTPKGDLVRAVVPVRQGSSLRVIVAELLLPEEISGKSMHLKELHESLLKLESLGKPVRLSYILILGFITLMLVFAGLWFSLKISRGITVPIQSLAIATGKVAAGDLSVRVDAQSEDEIGLLVTSFNQMVSQLKESKLSLERAYNESDKQRLYLENILQNINSGVIFLNEKGIILTVNKSACDILNIERKDVIGKDYRDFVKQIDSDDLLAMISGLEGSRLRDVSREVKVSVSGKSSVIRVYITAIRESTSARALGILAVFDDITEIVKAQRMVAWQEVARRLAHEIKNPLTPIRLSTERLLKKWREGDHHFNDIIEKSAKIIISEVESLKRLVDVFSRFGKMPEIRRVPTRISDLVDSVTALYKGFADVRFDVAIGNAEQTVSLDPEQIKRVLINIIDNAIRSMKNSGVITLTARTEDDNFIIDIADTGPGISGDEKERLFMPYFSKSGEGTGLGLAIAHTIVTDHGGRILVRDNAPHGSIFSIEIPAG